jgi:hypothetical protein
VSERICIGCLKNVTAWRRVGVQTSGNLLVYDDCLVFVTNSWRHFLPSLIFPGRVHDRLAAEQSERAPDELVARKRRNWMVHRDDVAEASFGTTRSGGGGTGGDTVVDLVLSVASAGSAVTKRTLEIELNGETRSKDPRVAGLWGDAEIDLLRRALGDKLAQP